MDHKYAKMLERIKKHERWLEKARKELEAYGGAPRIQCEASAKNRRGRCQGLAQIGDTLCWFHKKRK